MSKGHHHYRQSDLVKAMKAARLAGFSTVRVQIDSLGKICIIADTSHQVKAEEQKDLAQCAEDYD